MALVLATGREIPSEFRFGGQRSHWFLATQRYFDPVWLEYGLSFWQIMALTEVGERLEVSLVHWTHATWSTNPEDERRLVAALLTRVDQLEAKERHV